jgi:hypothetical protein
MRDYMAVEAWCLLCTIVGSNPIYGMNLSVGVGTCYGVDGLSSVPLQGQDFSPVHSVQTGSRVRVASCPIGTCGSFTGVKQQGREADHSLPSSAEVRMVELYLRPAICLHDIRLN